MPKGIRCAFVTQPCGAGRSSRNRLTSRSSSKGCTGTSNKTPTLQRFFLGLTGRRHAARARRATAADLQHDAIDARVFSGIHFRNADEVAIAMGAQVANWALDHHFAPANRTYQRCEPGGTRPPPGSGVELSASLGRDPPKTGY